MVTQSDSVSCMNSEFFGTKCTNSEESVTINSTVFSYNILQFAAKIDYFGHSKLPLV